MKIEIHTKNSNNIYKYGSEKQTFINKWAIHSINGHYGKKLVLNGEISKKRDIDRLIKLLEYFKASLK